MELMESFVMVGVRNDQEQEGLRKIRGGDDRGGDLVTYSRSTVIVGRIAAPLLWGMMIFSAFYLSLLLYVYLLQPQLCPCKLPLAHGDTTHRGHGKARLLL